MIRLSRLTDYAIVLMAHLAELGKLNLEDLQELETLLAESEAGGEEARGKD